MFQLLLCRNTQRQHYEDWSINPIKEIGIYYELCIVLFVCLFVLFFLLRFVNLA